MRALYMYKKFSPLDFRGDLWYDITVKLGCFAMDPQPRFDTRILAKNADRSKKGDGMGRFRGEAVQTLARLPICVALFSASCFTKARRANLCTVGGRCLTAGRAEFGGRAGEFGGYPQLWYALTSANAGVSVR